MTLSRSVAGTPPRAGCYVCLRSFRAVARASHREGGGHRGDRRRPLGCRWRRNYDRHARDATLRRSRLRQSNARGSRSILLSGSTCSRVDLYTARLRAGRRSRGASHVPGPHILEVLPCSGTPRRSCCRAPAALPSRDAWSDSCRLRHRAPSAFASRSELRSFAGSRARLAVDRSAVFGLEPVGRGPQRCGSAVLSAADRRSFNPPDL